MGGPLNLSAADTSGFDPIPTTWYDMAITDCSHIEVQGEEGKYPVGTPGYNVRFTVDGGEHDGRHVWNNYWIPGDDFLASASEEDKKKAAKTIGQFVNLLVAAGYDEKKVMGGKFNFEPEDLIGRKVRCHVGQSKATDQYPSRNVIRSVKRVETLEDAGIL